MDFCAVFFKSVKVKAVSFLLDKNIGKDFTCIKISSNFGNPSQSYGPPNLLFRFTDSYVCHSN